MAAKKRRPSAAARARAAFDPNPPKSSDDVPLAEHRRGAVKRARPPPRLLSKAEVLKLVPVSYPCLWAMMKRDEFPRSLQLSPGSNRVAWREDEVLAWIEALPRQRLKGDDEEAE